ncbi:hypothetical protein [Runella sp.]|uniref:hypothetical protein n=1 Tax=Runella sp. TaxID=1960881 RepID=UPI003D0A9CBF
MESNRPEYLIGKLMRNEMSLGELEEFLAGIGEKEMSPAYSEVLEQYFNELLSENVNAAGVQQEK